MTNHNFDHWTTWAVAFDISKVFDRVWQVFLEFQVRHLALFLLFSVIDGFEWFWMGSLYKNIQFMLEFLKAPFFVLHIFYYTLITFLMILSIMLLSFLMIILSAPFLVLHFSYYILMTFLIMGICWWYYSLL